MFMIIVILTHKVAAVAFNDDCGSGREYPAVKASTVAEAARRLPW